MPEGPSVRRWGDIARQFIHKQITEVRGVSKVMDRERWKDAYINDVIVYGKQLFFQLVKKGCGNKRVKGTLKSRKRTDVKLMKKTKIAEDIEDAIWYRYHFLMWGSLRANEYKAPSKRSKRAKQSESPKAPNPMVEFHFDDETFLVFYGGSIRIVDGPCEDEGTDILSETFDVEKAATALQEPLPVCYTLMDQTHFAGAGNIVKNEVLYARRVNPLELGNTLTRVEAVQLAEEVVRFTKDWLKWENESSGYETFSSFMKMYWKFKCPDGHKTMRGFFGSNLKRMTTWCPECQALRVESGISKNELQDIGKIKKTTRVQASSENISDDEDGDINRQVQKVKTKKGKHSKTSTIVAKKSSRVKYDEEEDDDDVFQPCVSTQRRTIVSQRRKNDKYNLKKERKSEDGSPECEGECKLPEVSSKNKSRKRTHSSMIGKELNGTSKNTRNIRKKNGPGIGNDDAIYENVKHPRKSSRKRFISENQEIRNKNSTDDPLPVRKVYFSADSKPSWNSIVGEKKATYRRSARLKTIDKKPR